MNRENFEQHKFDSMINLVPSENYPSKFSTHWHEDIELIAIPEDAKQDALSVIKVNQIHYELHSGDILFIWPGELHEIIENRGRAACTMQFPMIALTQMKDFTTYVKLYKRYHLLSFHEYPELTHNMLLHLQRVFTIWKEEKEFHNVKMLIGLYEMFITFGEYISSRSEKTDQQDNRYEMTFDKVQQACDYIQEKCDANITLETAAEHVGFSPCYFSRCFKRITTYSFVEYLLMQRVKRLQVLLMDQDITITEAAYQAGFKSISTLNRAFKRYCGCSPRDYKKYLIQNV